MTDPTDGPVVPFMRARRAPRRRGVAMMLALVALATASVLTTTYVVSRENTPIIGANAAAAASAEWAAKSGANTAVAILQTQANWLGDADPTALLTDFSLAGAKVSVLVTDLNGKPPKAGDTDLLLTTTAVVGATRKVLQRVVRYQQSVAPDAVVDPALGEFALFGASALSVDDTSTVGVWGLSPSAVAGKKAKIGAGFASSSSLTLGASAKLNGASLVVNASAGSGLKSMVNDAKLVKGEALPLDVPAAPASLPSSITAAGLAYSTGDKYCNAGTYTISKPGRYGILDIDNGGVVTLDDTQGGDFSFAKLDMRQQGVLRISGKVRVELRAEMALVDRATVELADSASSVEFYVRKAVSLDDAGLGVDRTVARNLSRSASSITQYARPDRVRVYSMNLLSGGVSNQNVALRGKSIAMASIHAPSQNLTVDANSVIIGRATADKVVIKNGGAVYYDPALDNNAGFTTRAGPLYDAAGAPVAGLLTGLSTFDAALGLQALPAVIRTSVGVVSVVAPTAGVVAARSAERAVGADWPVTALALEKTGAPADTTATLGANEVVSRLAAQKTMLVAAQDPVAVDSALAN